MGAGSQAAAREYSRSVVDRVYEATRSNTVKLIHGGGKVELRGMLRELREYGIEPIDSDHPHVVASRPLRDRGFIYPQRSVADDVREATLVRF